MKQYNPIDLVNAPQDLKDIDNQIKKQTIYLQVVSQGQYPGAFSEHLTNLKVFLSEVRDQLITAFDEHPHVTQVKSVVQPEKSE